MNQANWSKVKLTDSAHNPPTVLFNDYIYAFSQLNKRCKIESGCLVADNWNSFVAPLTTAEGVQSGETLIVRGPNSNLLTCNESCESWRVVSTSPQTGRNLSSIEMNEKTGTIYTLSSVTGGLEIGACFAGCQNPESWSNAPKFDSLLPTTHVPDIPHYFNGPLKILKD